MRDFFREQDLVVSEIQKVSEGASSECVLHMRSGKYGNLFNGQVVTVPASLVKKAQQHLEIAVDNSHAVSVLLVLGCNGNIFIGAPPKRTGTIQNLNFSQVDNQVSTVSAEIRAAIVKVRQVILFLAENAMEITAESVGLILANWTDDPNANLPQLLSLVKHKLGLF